MFSNTQISLCCRRPAPLSSQELPPPPRHLHPPQHPTRHSFAGIGTQSADDINTVLRDVLLRNHLIAATWTSSASSAPNLTKLIQAAKWTQPQFKTQH
ncbi:hypothetical protein QJS10_CPA08g01489 [Acorus calamus]|uniref:Uncharacterized protein n=1 Tax=Acorus calamus TaxID=4465 RepID=A0AAV9E985_ACOCL|nr:hypothetical protein QJS10_CPA08g01489 [Acorus calamus]